MSNFVIGVISSICGAVLVLLVQWFYNYRQEKKGAFSGYWKDLILDENENVIKQDLLKIKQKGNVIYGEITRIEPNEQSHRQWHFSGRIHGQNFFATFWPSDNSILSYGCWYVHQISDFSFSGFYLKLDEKHAHGIDTVPIEFEKITEQEYQTKLN